MMTGLNSIHILFEVKYLESHIENVYIDLFTLLTKRFLIKRCDKVYLLIVIVCPYTHTYMHIKEPKLIRNYMRTLKIRLVTGNK